jgi:hypothetical protein
MMKAIGVSFVLIILTFLACKKSLEEDNGCVQKLVIPVSSQGTLSTSDYNLINTLFTTNGINRSNLRPIRTYRDSMSTYNGTYDFRNVHVLEYTKDLPIFTGTLNFSFKNGIFESYAGRLLTGITPDITPSLSLGQLRKLFIDDIELFNHKGNQFKDSCVNAEFGYFNLNSGTGNNTENIVKAWHLTPRHIAYPEAYYQDNGQRIYYFDGIVYGH